MLWYIIPTLLTYAIILYGIVYGIAALIRGKIRLTRHSVIEGRKARFLGCVCLVVTIAFAASIWLACWWVEFGHRR